ncbi:DUF29 domain-containing protein [Endozoicomonas sp. ONNA1]|uniref:DUF29 domain-containing protein n=1 Tax=Endozoicomonas sp. ONNA1 TaxID=2828740 RepID=UPI002148E34D|nr:DUF29 domain-containing protein [Endozoicomonas sp. ONNA1]
MQSLYERDFYSWTCQQAELLKEGRLNELDIENLLEEVEAMGRSEYRTLKNCLKELLLHLLKWHMQSSKKDDLHDMDEWYRSWRVSIKKQRREVKHELDENPGLQNKLDKILATAYKQARETAADDMDCRIEDFPTECPWSYERLMTEDWLP